MPPPRPFQSPDPQAVRQQGLDLFDELSLPLLASTPAEDMQRFRSMFAEGYLHGWAKGALKALEQLLPEAPDSPAELFPEGQ